MSLLKGKERVMKVWSNGQILKNGKKIDSSNVVLHYAGPAVWEGIRSYLQEDGTTKIFKLEEHIQRLFNSAKILNIEIPFSYGDILQACRSIVETNGGGDLYIRPIVYLENSALDFFKDAPKANLDILTTPMEINVEKDIKTIISSRVRSYPQYQMQVKMPANYNLALELKSEAKRAGVDDVLVTDNQGYIVEAIWANILIVKGDIIFTPPNNGSILPGITRATLAENILLNPALMFSKYKKTPIVIEKNITRADIYTADCVMLIGTFYEIVNVVEIDGRIIGNNMKNTYYKILWEEYHNLIRGRK